MGKRNLFLRWRYLTSTQFWGAWTRSSSGSHSPEFGPGNIDGSKVEMTNNSVPYLIETQSNCMIDGEIKESNNNKVKDVLYGVKYGRSSK